MSGTRSRMAKGIAAALALALTPKAALAEVCDKLRPNWEPGTKVTMLGEAIYLFSTLPALILLAASALVVARRSQWGALAVVVLWTGFISVVVFFEDDDASYFMARMEGCVASPALFIVAVAAICTAMILYTLPRETRL